MLNVWNKHTKLDGKTSRYLDWFLKLKCSSDILRLGVLPSTNACKEITESFAATVALRSFIGIDRFSDKNWTAVVIGDGHRPRTGVMIAFQTKWSVYSIDPNLRGDCLCDRLTLIRKHIEETPLEFNTNVVIVGVHSHATPLVSWDSVKNPPEMRKLFINIPCCVKGPPPIGKFKFTSYEDHNIWSPHCTVQVYERVSESNLL